MILLTLGIGLTFTNSLQSASASASASASVTLSNWRAKKGVDAWLFWGASTALARSRASWYLDWSSSPRRINSPAGVHFVPMIWGSADVTTAALAEAGRYGPDLLTFNEPDQSSQANMTVAQALSLWPQLEATGLELASPAVATGAATPGGWLDQFMQGAAALNYRVNFIALHWYGSDFRASDAVSQLRGYLLAVHELYPTLPIWLTEYSLANFEAVTQYPSEAQQAAFVSASIAMLDRLTFVARFAWYALPTWNNQSTGLFLPGATPTPAGRAFTKAP